jgi:aspartate aminotransferase-like enzyme
MLPPDYVKAVGDAVHAVGGLFVLDGIASGAMWVDMKASGVDVVLSAPQKGWSSTACCGLVVLSEAARQRLDATQSTSFAMDLKKWAQIMDAFESGGHAYHATMPTDGLFRLREAMRETEHAGFATLSERQQTLGDRVREVLERKGFPSVAAKGFQSPGVVVSYTTDAEMQNGKKLLALGLQTAAGVPLQCDEGPDFKTFRIGLFGLDKLDDVDRTVRSLEHALNQA